jgi:DNA polymerase
VEKFGLKRSKFYISNAVKCYTERNEKPTAIHMKRCRPFLQMEMQLLRPVLVITLGAVGFDVFCPQKTMKECLGKIVESDVFDDLKVYAIYHPSPRNMSVVTRKKKFVEDVGRLCKLVKKYEADQPEESI